MSTPRPTMRDLAQLAHVSVMTVSLALRGHGRIAPETRARIQALAAEHGYRPNPFVSALMSDLRGKRHRRPDATATLAFIYHLPRPTLHSLVFMNSVYDGIRQRAHQLGFGVDTFFRRDAAARGLDLDRVLKARGIRGVIVGPTEGVTPSPDYALDWSHYALATFGFSVREPALHRAASFTYRSVRVAYRELWQRGYRRIGLVNTPTMHYRVDGNWGAGMYEAQLEHLGRVSPGAILIGEERAEFMRWVKRFRPDVILCNNASEQAWLEAAGLRVPRDIGIATLSPLEPRQLAQFAGVDQREGALGAATVDIIVEQLNTNSFGLPAVPKTVLVECAWRDGPSIRSGPRAARSASV